MGLTYNLRPSSNGKPALFGRLGIMKLDRLEQVLEIQIAKIKQYRFILGFELHAKRT